MKVALTIAGSDPTGAAGLEADLRVFQSLGMHGAAVATALTVQDTSRVHEVVPIESDLFRRRLQVLLSDLRPAVVKLGMLGTAGIATAVADLVEPLLPAVPLVIDPVIRSSSGAPLIDEGGLEVLVRRLLPRARAVTPNRAEAALLLGRDDEPAALAEGLARLGPEIVIVTGGDASEPEVRDFVWCREGGFELTQPRLPGPSPHGTGCTFAAALAVQLTRGLEAREAISAALRYVRAAIEGARPARGSSGRPLPRLKGIDDD